MKTTNKFQTESKELLNLMINSIYTNKEIFLREIISNASDAIDKYKFLSLSSEGKIPTLDHEIWIKLDKKNNTLSIKDNGVGMNKEDLVNNLGTIAKSGSKDFMKKIKEAKNKEELNIIGQFGVGFYSGFMVADKIEVITKKFDEPAYKFLSDGKEGYSIEDSDKADTGTEVILHLKKDNKDEDYSSYLEEYKIEELVKKYSDYIRYPIKMMKKVSKPDLDKDGKEIKDKYHDEEEVQILNSMIPLWKKNKNEVKEEEINEFYKNKFSDYEDPFTYLFLNVDGLLSYNALVFIPSHPPYNLYSENYEKGLDLYSKGIFIKEKCKELVPDYFKFIKGLVDSNDFSLNISREMLQSSPLLKKIEENIENKLIAKLKEIKDKEFDKYISFFNNYGDHIKYGIYSMYGMNKDKLQDLLIFNSLNTEKPISLKEYVDKKDKDQKVIYYASGKTIDSIKAMPQMEKYRKDGINVLLFDKQIDEFAIMMMREYDKCEFKNIADLATENLSKEEQDKIDELTASNKRILDNIKEVLKDEVDEVTLSSRLVDSPSCIVTKEGMSLSMEDTLKNDPSNIGNENEIKAKKVLEINPNHEIFTSLQALGNDDEAIKRYGSLLYDEALMLEGYEIKDKKEFVKKLNELFVKAFK